jgi:hypothetical protein
LFGDQVSSYLLSRILSEIFGQMENEINVLSQFGVDRDVFDDGHYLPTIQIQIIRNGCYGREIGA